MKRYAAFGLTNFSVFSGKLGISITYYKTYVRMLNIILYLWNIPHPVMVDLCTMALAQISTLIFWINSLVKVYIFTSIYNENN